MAFVRGWLLPLLRQSTTPWPPWPRRASPHCAGPSEHLPASFLKLTEPHTFPQLGRW